MAGFWENDALADPAPPAPTGARGFWEGDALADAAPNPQPQGGSEADRAIGALTPFFQKGVSTRNSAGQWTGEARAMLTKAGVNPDTIDQKAERGLLAKWDTGQQPAGDGAAAIGRGLLNGIPVAGPAVLGGVNRVTAFLRSIKDGIPYDEALRRVESFGERTSAENPVASTAGEVAGGVLGTAPLVAAAPAAFGAGAGGLAARSLLSGASGIGLGAADSAVRSGGDLGEVGKGAAIGGAFGVVAPGAGALVGRGVNAAVGALASRNARVPGAGNQAASRLAEDLRNSGGAETVQGRLRELGPEAMLLDASPSFEGRAQGLAVRPETREAITNPLVERARGANNRLATDVDAALGPNTDPAAFRATVDAAYAEAVPPLYARALAEPVTVDTSGVLDTIGRLGAAEKGGAQQALQRAWGLLHTEGEVPGVGRAMVPDRRPEALHNAKEALDSMIASVQAQQGSAAASELRALTAVRRGVNDALEAQVPGYAEANRTAQGFFQQRDAFDRGQTLLNGGREAIRPAQLAEETAAMAPEASAAQRAGLRTEIDRLVGTKLNDRVALQNAIQGEGDYNRARLGTVFGEEPTASLVGAVDRERAFDAAHQRIVNNSMTELRRQAAEGVAVRDLTPKAGDVGVAIAGGVGGPAGASAALGLKGLRLGANAAGRAADLARNRETAAILTMRDGPERDALIAALTARVAAAQRGEVPANAMDRFVRQLLQAQNDRSDRALTSAR